MGDRTAMFNRDSATPELRALLRQRLELSEGPGKAQGGLLSAPVRRVQQISQPGPLTLTSQVNGQRTILRGSQPQVARGPPSARDAPFQGNGGHASPSPRDNIALEHSLRGCESRLLQRNLQLNEDVAKFPGAVQLDLQAVQYLEERERLLAETDELLAQTDRITSESAEIKRQEEAMQAKFRELEAERQECERMHQQMRLRHQEDETQAARRREAWAAAGIESEDQVLEELMALRRRNESFRVEIEEIRTASRMADDDLRKQSELLEQENSQLRAQLAQQSQEAAPLREELGALRERLAAQASVPTPGGASSEGRLRAVMVSQSSTPVQLRQAIGAVEALIEEARRELANKELRERRAAFEKLHHALEKADEMQLAEAVEAARLAGVDLEDIQKGEAKLETLRSMTEEEKAAKFLRELESKRKKEAFMLVKKDDAASLEDLLDTLTVEVPEARWQDWRDFAGRNLSKCARDLKSSRVQKFLSERLDLQAPQETFQPKSWFRRKVTPTQLSEDVQEEVSLAESIDDQTPALARKPAEKATVKVDVALPITVSTDPAPVTPVGPVTIPLECRTGQGEGDAAGGDPRDKAPSSPPPSASPAVSARRLSTESAVEPPTPSSEEESKLKAKALRAVVQDDCESLGEVLELVSSDIWQLWVNKAGKDLLTLSQERGSTCAYAVLAKALGMMKEMTREAYEEHETVWVFLHGEVQPRRATVMEDASEEDDEVLLEYWDGDAPAERVDRCLVRKMWS